MIAIIHLNIFVLLLLQLHICYSHSRTYIAQCLLVSNQIYWKQERERERESEIERVCKFISCSSILWFIDLSWQVVFPFRTNFMYTHIILRFISFRIYYLLQICLVIFNLFSFLVDLSSLPLLLLTFRSMIHEQISYSYAIDEKKKKKKNQNRISCFILPHSFIYEIRYLRLQYMCLIFVFLYRFCLIDFGWRWAEEQEADRE